MNLEVDFIERLRSYRSIDLSTLNIIKDMLLSKNLNTIKLAVEIIEQECKKIHTILFLIENTPENE